MAAIFGGDLSFEIQVAHPDHSVAINTRTDAVLFPRLRLVRPPLSDLPEGYTRIEGSGVKLTVAEQSLAEILRSKLQVTIFV